MEDLAGTCFGFAVRSDLSFHFLRAGEGDALSISVLSEETWLPTADPVVEWIINRDGLFHARLYEDGPRFRLWVGDSGWYVIDPYRPSISLPENGNSVKREARLWGIPAVLCFLARGDLALHAAAVEINGESVLLAAPGTFGKTTLAAAFLRAGYRVLGEDLSCLRLNGQTAVAPGPAMLRVRRDIADRLELPFGRRLDAGDERTHIALDSDHRGDSAVVPLRAIVFLRESDDGVKLERVDPADAIRDLWTLSFALPTRVDRARCFNGVADLAHTIPIWNLSRPLRLEELERTVERLVAGV